MAPRLTFINLPVASPAASRAFFERLGFEVNEKFTDDTCTCVVVSEQSYVMLLSQAKFEEFVVKPVADSGVTGQLVCFSADSREDVDQFTETALANGASPAKDPMDYGFMYGRSFLDPDGHHWEVMWMSEAAVEAGAGYEAEPV